jgi:hypothetical protein
LKIIENHGQHFLFASLSLLLRLVGSWWLVLGGWFATMDDINIEELASALCNDQGSDKFTALGMLYSLLSLAHEASSNNSGSGAGTTRNEAAEASDVARILIRRAQRNQSAWPQMVRQGIVAILSSRIGPDPRNQYVATITAAAVATRIDQLIRVCVCVCQMPCYCSSDDEVVWANVDASRA